MSDAKPRTIAQYIEAAPPRGRDHLRRLYTILADVAPDAEQTIKWGAPFFVEPRFLFSFSAHKAHCNFAPSVTALEAFRDELVEYRTTKHYLQISYTDPVPEDLVRRIAEFRVSELEERDDESFW